MLPSLAEIEAAFADVAAYFAAPVPTPARKPANVLSIDGHRGPSDYRVTPFPTTWGRGYTLAKVGGVEVYSVLVGGRGEPDRCDCAAATFSPHKPCKHVLACRKLASAPSPEAAVEQVLRNLGGVAVPKLTTRFAAESI